jgi:hypothetical protein
MNTPDDDLTDDHMRLLEWLDAHPTGSLAAAAQALDVAVTDPDHSNARSGHYLLNGQFAVQPPLRLLDRPGLSWRTK